ncbi:GNAT family N-acetyltransferase [Granulibacter bethesdensis]|uniref:Acetyltransferase n=1 Tax=Granulibacter bethesdensis TaxID=364410 RepID=A0AAN0RFR7_9PROT|nr:GNAT family N-acetyltransferase [Granulibacter bethesdensis]AHJ64133.1 Acetyltransferase [Granulibacter bethesdensis]APH60577.1 Acetyltransferase [Granulibacter bethesdensis]
MTGSQPPEDRHGEQPAQDVERVEALSDDDIASLCEAAHAAILDGGGSGWITPPGHQALERYFRGVLLVPERELFIARQNGAVVGAAQFIRPAKNEEARAFGAMLAHSFVAPFARGFGLARLLTERVEDCARALGFQVLNLDLREDQEAAKKLYESMGYICWGTHPVYARARGQTLRGYYYYKLLQADSRIMTA